MQTDAENYLRTRRTRVITAALGVGLVGSALIYASILVAAGAQIGRSAGDQTRTWDILGFRVYLVERASDATTFALGSGALLLFGAFWTLTALVAGRRWSHLGRLLKS